MNYKFGAQYQLQIERQGTVVAKTPFIDNVILDKSSEIMLTGFSEQPIPVIGASDKPAQSNQNGALDPILGLSVKSITPAKLIATSGQNTAGGLLTWEYVVKFTYQESGDVIREIAIDNFSRMSIVDFYGKNYGITVNTNDVVTVRVRLNMTLSPVSQTLALIDKAAVLPNGDYPMNFSFDISKVSDQWWLLFSGLTVDYIQSENTIIASASSITVDGRKITVKDHFKPDDFYCYGFKFNSKLLGNAFLTTKFVNPIDFIDGQEFDTVSVIQW